MWLFLIPVGVGIPSGVLLAKKRGISWVLMTCLYFVSDVILACVFEPIMCGVLYVGKRQAFIARIGEAMRRSAARSASHFGTRLGPLALIMVSFGIDPMTGRSAARAMGHGFVVGWGVAIAGDMLYFGVLAYSTLVLNKVVDELWTTVIILSLSFIVPSVVRKIKQQWTLRR